MPPVCLITVSYLSDSSFVFRFWFFKFAALVAVTVAAFYIPDGPFTYSKNFIFELFKTQIIKSNIQ